MKRMYPAVLLLIIVAASTVSVKSQQAWTPGPAPRNSVDQMVTVFGHGTLSCGVWLNERRNRTPRADAMTTWANGFLTGMQSTQAIPSDQARDMEGRDAWLDQYCQTHPLDTWYVAVSQLFSVLTKQ